MRKTIHQQALIPATPGEVYRVLTDGERFAAATGQPAHVTDREGDAFSLFGGRVEGRQRTAARASSSTTTRCPRDGTTTSKGAIRRSTKSR